MAPRKKQQSYEPERSVHADLSGGVNYGKPASKLDDKEFADLLNLQYYKGILRVDAGYTKYRQTVQGIPQGQFQFITTAQQVQDLLITTKFVYLDNGTQWAYVGDGTATTSVANQIADNQFRLADVSTLQVGNPVGIALNDATQFQSTITSIDTVNKTVITADHIPGGKAAALNALFVRPLALNGQTIFQVVGITWPPINVFIFTNGIDPVMQFDGLNLVPLPGWGRVQSCRVLVPFHGFLIAGDVTEGGVRIPQRLRWADQGNVQALVGGLSGFIDLQDTEDTILAMEELGPWIIIYRESSIMRRSYIGDPLQPFFDEYMITGVGIFGGGCVANAGASHVIAGDQGIFRYTGGYDIESVGDKIFDNLMGAQGILNTSVSFLTFMFYVSELDEVWLFVATGQNTVPDTVYRYDQGNDAYYVRKFANQFIGFGFIEAFSGRTWQQAAQAWNTDTSAWLSRAKQVQAPLTVLCDTAGNTYLYDFIAATDNGAAIPWSATTKDFESPTSKIVFDAVYAKGTGSNVLVEISYDRGKSFIPIGTWNFGLTFSQQQVNMQIEVDCFRLRFSGSDPTSSIDWYRVDYYPGHPW